MRLSLRRRPRLRCVPFEVVVIHNERWVIVSVTLSSPGPEWAPSISLDLVREDDHLAGRRT
jgi:hypothetical protein